MNNTREHILSTSLKLFLQKSFKEVTMKEIVTETGLSKGAFYHYFKSKEQVFEEVINHFFSDLMTINFDQLSHHSLKEFCADLLKMLDRKINESRLMEGGKAKKMNANHYFLLFDALKMLPNFEKKQTEMQKLELKAWTRIIGIARKNGEIKSGMPDEQIAKMYVYMNDGLGINLIMKNNMHKMRKEFGMLMETLYSLLKK